MFKFKRTFGTQTELEKIEKKISQTKNIGEALECIPSNYPDYIVEEVTKELNEYFKGKENA